MIEIDKRYCPENHPCPVVRRCPFGAIKQEGFKVPYIDEEKCRDCGMCARFCPTFKYVKSM